jgi:hypothetical protein
MPGFPNAVDSQAIRYDPSGKPKAVHTLFWLSDDAWAAIEPHLPKNQPGARRVDDRRVISGIVHMLKCVAVGRIVRSPSFLVGATASVRSSMTNAATGTAGG